MTTQPLPSTSSATRRRMASSTAISFPPDQLPPEPQSSTLPHTTFTHLTSRDILNADPTSVPSGGSAGTLTAPLDPYAIPQLDEPDHIYMPVSTVVGRVYRRVPREQALRMLAGDGNASEWNVGRVGSGMNVSKKNRTPLSIVFNVRRFALGMMRVVPLILLGENDGHGNSLVLYTTDPCPWPAGPSVLCNRSPTRHHFRRTAHAARCCPTCSVRHIYTQPFHNSSGKQSLGNAVVFVAIATGARIPFPTRHQQTSTPAALAPSNGALLCQPRCIGRHISICRRPGHCSQRACKRRRCTLGWECKSCALVGRRTVDRAAQGVGDTCVCVVDCRHRAHGNDCGRVSGGGGGQGQGPTQQVGLTKLYSKQYKDSENKLRTRAHHVPRHLVGTSH